MRTISLTILFAIALAVGFAPGQAAPPNSEGGQVAPLVYDAVSIKPNKSGSGSVRFSIRDATFQANNASVTMLLVNAYGIRDGLISGLPAWAESSRYDINAKVIDFDPAVIKSVSQEQRRAMMMAILVERFGLKAHIETKTLPVYELVVAKDGPKFKESSPPAPVDPDRPKTGPGRGGTSISTSQVSVELNADSMLMPALARMISDQVDRPVIDKTGLAGKYTVHLKWTRDDASSVPDDAPPPLFTAIQEQLGLKLQPAKGPVETLVVDRVEEPTEN